MYRLYALELIVALEFLMSIFIKIETCSILKNRLSYYMQMWDKMFLKGILGSNILNSRKTNII